MTRFVLLISAAVLGAVAFADDDKKKSAIEGIEPGQGLVGEYFADSNFSTPVFSRRDERLEFNWAFGSPEERMPEDGFTVRWSGYLKAPQAGNYQFIAYVEGAVRLSIDGKPVIDVWNREERLSRHAAVSTLTGKPQKIKIEYRSGGAGLGAVCSLNWMPPWSKGKELPLATGLMATDEKSFKKTQRKKATQGLLCEIFQGESFNKQVDSLNVSGVHSYSGVGPLTERSPADGFSVRYSGWLTASTPGRYKLTGVADDGFRLWLDETLVIDAWTSSNFHHVDVEFDEKPKKFRYEGREGSGNAGFVLMWKPPQGTRTVSIPVSAFSPPNAIRSTKGKK